MADVNFSAAASEPDTVPGRAARSSQTVLAVRGLSKRFGRHQAVVDVTFSARSGRIHGLLGPNGAGKTTVLRMLLGLVSPDTGSIEFGGTPLQPDFPRGRTGIAGFVETPAFYPYLTASRNLELLSAWDGPTAHTRVEKWLEIVGLADRAQTRVRNFSTGMRQRLGLAAALISDPQVLLMDEPTTGLDPAGIRDLHVLLESLAESGHTIVLSSHDLAEVELLCTDVTVLSSGSVVYDGTLTSLRNRAPDRMWQLHTSDDQGARTVQLSHPQVIEVGPDSGHLMIRSDVAHIDAFVLALAQAGIAVRELRREQLPFESLFFQLTEASPTDSIGCQP